MNNTQKIDEILTLILSLDEYTVQEILAEVIDSNTELPDTEDYEEIDDIEVYVSDRLKSVSPEVVEKVYNAIKYEAEANESDQHYDEE